MGEMTLNDMIHSQVSADVWMLTRMRSAIDAHLAQAGEVVAWEDPTGFSIAMVKDEAKNWTSRSTRKQMLLNYAASMEALARPHPAVPDAWIKAFRADVAHWPNHYLSQRLERLLDLLSAAPESGGG